LWRLHGARRLLSAFMALTFFCAIAKMPLAQGHRARFHGFAHRALPRPVAAGWAISRAVISARLTGWLFPDAWIMVPALAGTVLIITGRWITACGDPHP